MNWGEKDNDIGLNLSLELKCPEAKISRPPPTNFPYQQQQIIRPSLNNALQSSPETRSIFRPSYVNQLPVADPSAAAAAVSSPNSTISSASGKRSEREENEAERNSASSEGGGGEDDGGDESARKKLRLSKEQMAVLEGTFKVQSTLSLNQKVALAKQLNLQTRQVEVWFQNRRARTKLKKTEFDCEYLKRRCEDLTQENQRLHKEVSELRALKHSPQAYSHANPPTTLSMCPQCERVAVLPKSSPTTSSTPLAATRTSMARHITPVGPQHKKSTPINSWLINSHKPQAA